MIPETKINGVRLVYLHVQPDELDVVFDVGGTVKDITISSGSIYGVNFNFADTSLGIPIGRVITDGKQVIHDNSKTYARDEFYSDGKHVHIGKSPEDVKWAVQGSPPLLKDGKIVVDEMITRDQLAKDIWQSKAYRVAVGILKDNSVLIVRTLDKVSLNDLAKIMQQAGCIDALNGDGGGSAYLYPYDTGWGRKMGVALVVNKKVEGVGSMFEGYRVTSPFGWRKDPFTGADAFHTGIDLVKSHKAPIHSFTNGEVLHAKEGVTGSGFGGFGIVVAIKDEYGALHCYCHLDSASVKVGQKITKGQEIGKQGNTGKSTGSHLHYEVRKTSSVSYGWRVGHDHVHNPGEYLKNYKPVTSSDVKMVDIELNGVVIGQGELKNGRTMTPARLVAEALGATVGWDGKKVIIRTKE